MATHSKMLHNRRRRKKMQKIRNRKEKLARKQARAKAGPPEVPQPGAAAASR